MKKLIVLILLAGSLFAAKTGVTVKGSYTMDSVLGLKQSGDYNYKGLYDVKVKDEQTQSVTGGLGLGAEYAVFSQQNIEALAGVNYALPRNITHHDGTLKETANSASTKTKYKEDIDAGAETLQVTSLYIAPRYLFDGNSDFTFYAGGKLSYNLISLKSDADLELDSAIGYGLFVGMLIAEDWDASLVWETLGSSIGGTKDTYDISNISLSVGYRI
jgi:hypothetical protein